MRKETKKFDISIAILGKKSNKPGWNIRMRKETKNFRFGIANFGKKNLVETKESEKKQCNSALVLLFLAKSRTTLVET